MQFQGNRIAVWSVVRAAVFFGVFLASARAQIPLTLVNVPNGGDTFRQQLWIYLGINNAQSGGAPVVRPYLFDTGSSMFNAAYYTGNNTNPNQWTANATTLTNTTYGYGRGDDTLNLVQVSSIEVYQNATSTTPVYTFPSSAGASLPLGGYVIGQVTDSTMPRNPSYANFQSALENNASPYDSGVFGTFGAGMFTAQVGPHDGKVVVGSVLGQSTTTGWAVVANQVQPQVILGLDHALRSQFESKVDWESGGTSDPFPNSGATSGTEFDTKFDFSVANGGNSTTWSTLSLLDTGTADTNIFDLTARDHLSTNDLLSGDQVLDGSTFSATGHSLTHPNQPYSFTTNSTYEVNGDPVPTLQVLSYNRNGDNGPVATMGINFFLSNSVAFDLENQQTLYTSQVVPEPSVAALAAVAGGALLMWRRVARIRRASDGGKGS